MSAISSIASQSLATYLQQLQANQSAGTTSASSTAPSSQTSAGSNFDNTITSALQAQGVTGNSLSTLRSSIESAVQQAQSSGNASAGAVQSAVDSVVKAAGLDTTEFNASVEKGHGHHHGGHGGPDGPSANGSSSTNGSSSGISALLAQAGINPSTFKSSLSQLVSTGNTSSAAIATLFSGAQAGSDVDVLA